VFNQQQNPADTQTHTDFEVEVGAPPDLLCYQESQKADILLVSANLWAIALLRGT